MKRLVFSLLCSVRKKRGNTDLHLTLAARTEDTLDLAEADAPLLGAAPGDSLAEFLRAQLAMLLPLLHKKEEREGRWSACTKEREDNRTQLAPCPSRRAASTGARGASPQRLGPGRKTALVEVCSCC